MIGFLYKLGDYGYRRIVTLITVLWWIFLVVLAILGFFLSEIIFPILVILWGIFLTFMYFSKQKTEAGTRWTLRTMWQQVKDWRHGRKDRMTKKENLEYV